MDKALGYIFGDLQILKHDMKVTANNFKRQRTINIWGAMALGCLWGFSVGLNECRIKQEEKIESLTKEIEELKEAKGE